MSLETMIYELENMEDYGKAINNQVEKCLRLANDLSYESATLNELLREKFIEKEKI
jgi:hypothetical protein